MATLNEIFASNTSEIRNRITAAGWIKAKALLTTGTPSDAVNAFAKRMLGGAPNDALIHGVLILLEDNADPSDGDVQTAVDAVAGKLADLGA